MLSNSLLTTAYVSHFSTQFQFLLSEVYCLVDQTVSLQNRNLCSLCLPENVFILASMFITNLAILN